MRHCTAQENDWILPVLYEPYTVITTQIGLSSRVYNVWFCVKWIFHKKPVARTDILLRIEILRCCYCPVLHFRQLYTLFLPFSLGVIYKGVHSVCICASSGWGRFFPNLISRIWFRALKYYISLDIVLPFRSAIVLLSATALSDSVPYYLLAISLILISRSVILCATIILYLFSNLSFIISICGTSYVHIYVPM